MLRRLAVAAVTAAVLTTGLTVAPAEAALPSKARWVSDTYAAMNGSRSYTARRVLQGGHKLAINLDIDNTSLASHYDYGHAVAATLRYAQHATDRGVVLLFNTGRTVGQGRLSRAAISLHAAGYKVTEICGRTSNSEGLAHSKQRCRQHFVDEGYTLIANVGNRSTDFVGGNYERAFRLPNYGNQLA